jgi:hypothetical protein
MTGADLEDAPARELHADDVVLEDARVTNPHHGDRHDGLVHHAVDEVTDGYRRDRAFACGRRDGRVGRRADWTSG